MVGDLDPRDDKRGVGGGGGGGGLIMVGGLVRRYDSEGGGRCTLQAQYERRGEGELLSRRGGGTLHERATL